MLAPMSDKTQFNVRIPVPLRARLSRFADRTGITPSSATCEALLAYLSTREPPSRTRNSPANSKKPVKAPQRPLKAPAR